MGTRNLTCVVLNGEYRIAQYGQWDGYPSGQGATALEFLQRSNLVKFCERVKACRYVTDDEQKTAWRECAIEAGEKPDGDFFTDKTGNRFRSRFPLIDRDLGADILKIVRESSGEVLLRNSLSFAGDSLSCEYAYVIDLDQMTFEVYHGFIKEPHTGERFSNFKIDDYESTNDDGSKHKWHPVKHWVTFKIDALPSKADFLKLADKPDEDEEAA